MTARQARPRRAWLLVALALVAVPAMPTHAASAPAPACDPIDPAACLLPFPNDFFTVADSTSATGRRVQFSADQMPRNGHGTPINPAGWNANDGFSPGSPILLRVPGVDLTRSGVAPVTDIGRSLRPDAPIVLLNTRTGERHPYWAELDSTTNDSSRQTLIIRPARNLDEGTRYIVAVRRLRDANGALIPRSPVFDALLHGLGPPERRPHFRGIFHTLTEAHIKRDSLYLAWDFTVASEVNISGRLLHIRDDAFASLRGAAPTFTVTNVTDFTREANARIARRVTGTYEVPSYLDAPGGPPGSGFAYAPDGLPRHTPGNTQLQQFVCDIPRVAFTTPAQPALYGHGLFSDRTEVQDDNVQAMASEHDFSFCGTDWLGLWDNAAEIGSLANVFLDASKFPAFADRLQQGILNVLFLGRLMIAPDGFTANAAFRSGTLSLLDRSKGLVYDGNSVGGVMGGALTAVATDFTRAVLGVPGMNFSTMLTRSSDFPISLIRSGYPDPLDEQLVFALLQMLWDRGETDGYALHMTTRPLPHTPAHRVLLHVAFGDFQVANVASDVEARTIGASVRAPVLAAGRSPDVQPAWAIPRIAAFPFAGSAMVVFDSGTPAPPTENVPPSAGEDPHQDPRSSAIARAQKATFLSTGRVVDVCGSGPCVIPHVP